MPDTEPFTGVRRSTRLGQGTGKWVHHAPNTLPGLPPEMLYEIGRYLSPPPVNPYAFDFTHSRTRTRKALATLRALAQTCKRLRAAYVPVAWSQVQLTLDLKRIFDAVVDVRNRELFRHVRVVDIDIPNSRFTRQTLARCLASLPSAHTLQVMHAPWYDGLLGPTVFTKQDTFQNIRTVVWAVPLQPTCLLPALPGVDRLVMCRAPNLKAGKPMEPKMCKEYGDVVAMLKGRGEVYYPYLTVSEDTILHEIIQKLPTLRALNVRISPLLTPEALLALGAMKRLHYVNLIAREDGGDGDGGKARVDGGDGDKARADGGDRTQFDSVPVFDSIPVFDTIPVYVDCLKRALRRGGVRGERKTVCVVRREYQADEGDGGDEGGRKRKRRCETSVEMISF
ncbi:hypothetical protein PLICRDRAFT_35125 [Plicaturopsis crispa FD-325 SS-3]|nr:hypothetical protein PLICRDRAFT_35125 [Plicaturopsis crispa FD-325 SS-3]